MQNVTDRPNVLIDEPLSGPILQVSPAPTVVPRGFVHSVFSRQYLIARPRADVWAWLDDPATFTDGQAAPYRSEFVENDEGQGGFAEGVYLGQVGPLLSLSGVLGVVEPDRYRDVQYFFGSYVGHHGLFRPTRLQFWLDDGPGERHTELRVRVDAHVRRRAEGTWDRMMDSCWTRFGRSSARADACRWIH